jgi:RNA-directed DNA polymerase
LLGKLKEICRRYDSQAVGRVVAGINPILAQLGELLPDRACHPVFADVTNWVEKKVRRNLVRARNRWGWTRWRTVGLHEALGLFHDYGVQRTPKPE